MDSIKKQEIADVKKDAAFHRREIKMLKGEFNTSLTFYKKALESLKKSIAIFKRAMKKYNRNSSEKYEVLLSGSEKKLVRDVASAEECARKINKILESAESNYNRITELLIEADTGAAATAVVKKKRFLEKAVMAIDEVEQIIGSTPVPTVDQKELKVISLEGAEVEATAEVAAEWAPHSVNHSLQQLKMDLKCILTVYKKSVRNLCRKASRLAKAVKKYGKSSSAKGTAVVTRAKDAYLEAVKNHNEVATEINGMLDSAYACYDALKSALAENNKRSIVRVAAEQDKYVKKLNARIKKLRSPIVKMGIKMK